MCSRNGKKKKTLQRKIRNNNNNNKHKNAWCLDKGGGVCLGAGIRSFVCGVGGLKAGRCGWEKKIATISCGEFWRGAGASRFIGVLFEGWGPPPCHVVVVARGELEIMAPVRTCHLSDGIEMIFDSPYRNLTALRCTVPAFASM